MRKSVEDYVECGSCQQRKGSHEYKAPLGNPVAPFEVTSMDITGPDPLTRERTGIC